ncbi:hypothetical protein V6N13_050539 [Hibiscus sabdariffa]|uniref:Sulfotransferase n=1 Tax=Hibiscus sabdariffa TaxID=183260 RepID=A0ABR2PHZ6_9ROSI
MSAVAPLGWLKALTLVVVTQTRSASLCWPRSPMIAFPRYRIMAKSSISHIPYHALPKSDCKVVYICKEPKDAFVSLYHFSGGSFPSFLPRQVLLRTLSGPCSGVLESKQGKFGQGFVTQIRA